MALDIRIQFFEQVCGVFGAETTKVLVLQEEVDAQVGLSDDSRILDGEMANTRQNEVLQRLDTNDAGPIVDKKDVRVLERDLSGGSPQSQLAVIPAVVRSCL